MKDVEDLIALLKSEKLRNETARWFRGLDTCMGEVTSEEIARDAIENFVEDILKEWAR